ncbi:MAG: hypothetical protein AAFU85_12760 [Planctomycetota bacterium]
MSGEAKQGGYFSLYLLIGLTIAMTVAMLGLSFWKLDLSAPTLDSLPPIERARTKIAERNPGLPLDAWRHTESNGVLEVTIKSSLLFNLEPLRGISIQSLRLQEVRVSDLAPLAGSASLKEFECSDDPLLQSVEPLRGLPELQKLNIIGTSVTDLSPLMECPDLDEIMGDNELLLSSDHLKQHPNADRMRLNGQRLDQFFEQSD